MFVFIRIERNLDPEGKLTSKLHPKILHVFVYVYLYSDSPFAK